MKSKSILIPFALLVLGIFFLIKGAVLAEAFFVPLTFAVLLALVCVPMVRKFEKIGMAPGLASFASVIICILAYGAFFFVIAVQVGNVSEKWPEMKKELAPKVDKVIQDFEDKTGLSVQDQIPHWLGGADSASQSEAQAQSNSNSGGEQASSQQEEPESESSDGQEKKGSTTAISDGVKKQLGQLAVNLFGFLGSSFLTFVYVFFLLNYRHKVKLSILRFFSAEKRDQAKEVLEKSIKLSLNFLGGRLLLILFLSIIYTVGMLIAGVENAILISVIAAILSLIPYLGVVIGYVLAISMTLFGGLETWPLIVVTITYGAAQFIESYILEPFVVGDKVNLNPLTTIIVVVVGSSIWGVAGMILSIPIAGILKIIFDSTRNLEPLGYMLGEEDAGDDEEGFLSKWGEKLRGMFNKK